MTLNELPSVLDVLLNADITPMILGPHGIGKTQSVRKYAQDHGYQFVSIRLGNLVDAGDLLGLADFVRDERGQLVATRFVPPEWWPQDPNSKGIIFLDEINRARSSSILQAVFSLAEPRKIGGRVLHTHQLPVGWKVAAASNPPTEDYDVIDIKDAAFVDRFCYLPLQFSSEIHEAHMRDAEFEQDVRTFAKAYPEAAYPLAQSFTIDFVKSSPRSLDLLSDVRKLNPAAGVFSHIVRGLLGPTAGAAFLKMLRDKDTLFKVQDLLDGHPDAKGQFARLCMTKKLDQLCLVTDRVLAVLADTSPTQVKDIRDGLLFFIQKLPADLLESFKLDIVKLKNTRTAMAVLDLVGEASL